MSRSCLTKVDYVMYLSGPSPTGKCRWMCLAREYFDCHSRWIERKSVALDILRIGACRIKWSDEVKENGYSPVSVSPFDKITAARRKEF